jgi:hypothetical protein
MNMFAEITRYVPAAAEVFRNIDFDKLMRQTWYNNNGSMTALREPTEVKDERAAEQQAQAQQVQQQSLMNGAQAASMGSKRPEEGSPTAKMMEAQGV